LLKHKGGEKRVQTKCISEVCRRDHPLMGSAVSHPLLLSSCAFNYLSIIMHTTKLMR
jgi:hypothetical protein